LDKRRDYHKLNEESWVDGKEGRVEEGRGPQARNLPGPPAGVDLQSVERVPWLGEGAAGLVETPKGHALRLSKARRPIA